VWVILDTDQGTASKVRDTDQPQSDKDALISEMRERVASLERQLESERQANSEHRRLLAAALERIPSAIEAPPDSPPGAPRAPEDASPVTEPHEGASPMGETSAQGVRAVTPPVTPPSTALLFAIGAGLVAGASNPVLVPRIGIVLSLAALLWVLPPIFGLWLGRSVALLMDYFYTRAEDLRKQIDNFPPPQNDEQGNKLWALEERYSNVVQASYKEGGRPALYAVLVALATFCGSLERVMNSIRIGLGMRETEIAKDPSRPWKPHSYAVFAQVHNTL